jgi:hypothetical protein
MEQEKKKARIEQITANQELKRNTQTKDSIAMENPAYIETELEVKTSTFNEEKRPTECTSKQVENVSVPSEKETSKITEDNATGHLQHQEVMTNGNNTIVIHNILTLEIKKIVKLTVFLGQTFPLQCAQQPQPKTKMHQDQPTMKIRVSFKLLFNMLL